MVSVFLVVNQTASATPSGLECFCSNQLPFFCSNYPAMFQINNNVAFNYFHVYMLLHDEEMSSSRGMFKIPPTYYYLTQNTPHCHYTNTCIHLTVTVVQVPIHPVMFCLNSASYYCTLTSYQRFW